MRTRPSTNKLFQRVFQQAGGVIDTSHSLLADNDVDECVDRHHGQYDKNHGRNDQDLPARVDHIDISQVSRVPSWGRIESL